MAEIIPHPSNPVEIAEPDWSAIFTDELLQARAAEVWRDTLAEMRSAGTLAPINGNQVKRYCIAVVMFDEAATHVAEQGAVIPARRTKSGTYNPWWVVLKDADSHASAHEDKLGLNPRRRAQVAPAKKKAGKVGASAAYLAGRG